MQEDLTLLKEVLSVPTKTYEEEAMIAFLLRWLQDNDIQHYMDEYGNVYAIKEEEPVEDGFYFPCVVSHTDTVHEIDTINIREEMLKNAQGQLKMSYKAYNDEGNPTGIGGDDKCGVFACLKLLKKLPYLKAAFFVSEETGCHGSRNADSSFFDNVGYAIQFDAPENWMITEVCSGKVIFDRDSDFFTKCDKVLTEGMDNNKMRYMSHPYTDVYSLSKKFDFSCINFSIGYYDYHSRNEYVVIEDVYNGIELGRQMIELLGYRKYENSLEESQQYKFRF